MMHFVLWLSMIVTVSFLWMPRANAVDLSSGEVEANLDTTISYGITVRVEEQEEALTSQVNDNDGDLNYERGIVSSAVKFTSDLDVRYRNFGLFLRGSGFFDFENESGERDYVPLTDAAKTRVGKDIDLLDAYVTGSFDAGETTLDVRLGKHVLNWGESTFIPNGINAINPFDVSKLRVPGAELREALVAVPLVSAAVGLSDDLSIEGFYQIVWEKTEIDPVGTYFSSSDWVGPGATRAFINHPDLVQALASNPTGPVALGDDPDFLDVKRGSDRNPGDDGQGGVALRYLAEELGNTEFGFYFMNYHSRLPTVRAHTGTAASAGQGLATMSAVAQNLIPSLMAGGMPLDQAQALAGQLALPYGIDLYADTGYYFVEYPRDIQLYGVSFNTQLGGSGWALQGEYSFRNDVPLQIAERKVIEYGLAPFLACVGASTGYLETLIAAGLITNPANAQQECIALGAPFTDGFEADVDGYVLSNVSQAQMTATRVFGPTLGADAFVFLTEVALMHVHNMPGSDLPLESPAESPGNPTDSDADATSFGYRMAARLDYGNAVGGANLFPYIQFQHDVSGNSPAPIGPFVEGRTAVTVGLRADYLARWEGVVSYTTYAGKRSEIRDRDFVTATIKYSF